MYQIANRFGARISLLNTYQNEGPFSEDNTPRKVPCNKVIGEVWMKLANTRLRGGKGDLRLTLEILHDIEKPIVYFGVFYKSHLDLIQVAQGILRDTLVQL